MPQRVENTSNDFLINNPQKSDRSSVKENKKQEESSSFYSIFIQQANFQNKLLDNFQMQEMKSSSLASSSATFGKGNDKSSEKDDVTSKPVFVSQQKKPTQDIQRSSLKEVQNQPLLLKEAQDQPELEFVTNNKKENPVKIYLIDTIQKTTTKQDHAQPLLNFETQGQIISALQQKQDKEIKQDNGLSLTNQVYGKSEEQENLSLNPKIIEISTPVENFSSAAPLIKEENFQLDEVVAFESDQTPLFQSIKEDEGLLERGPSVSSHSTDLPISPASQDGQFHRSSQEGNSFGPSLLMENIKTPTLNSASLEEAESFNVSFLENGKTLGDSKSGLTLLSKLKQGLSSQLEALKSIVDQKNKTASPFSQLILDLKPECMESVKVNLKMHKSGHVTAAFLTDNQMDLNLLSQVVRDIQNIFKEAGFDFNQQNLQFSTRDQNNSSHSENKRPFVKQEAIASVESLNKNSATMIYDVPKTPNQRLNILT